MAKLEYKCILWIFLDMIRLRGKVLVEEVGELNENPGLV